MTGPCPHCGTTITSPGPEDEKPAVQQVTAKVEVPAVVVKERVEVPAGPAPAEPARPAPVPPPLPPAPKQVPVEPVIERKVEAPAPAPEPAPVKAEPVMPPAAAPVPVETKAPSEPVKVALPPPVAPHQEPVTVVQIPREIVPPPVPRREPEPVAAQEISRTPPLSSQEDIPARQDAAPPPKQDFTPPPPVPEKPAIPVSPAPAPEIEELVTRPAAPVAVPVVPAVQPVPASPAQAVPVAPAAQPVVVPVVPPPVVPPAAPVPAHPVTPVQPLPEPEEPKQAAPAKISIGLSDEAMAARRPEPTPVPEPEPVAVAPAIQAAPAASVAPSTPDVLPTPTKGKNPNKPRRSILGPMLTLLALVLAGGGAVLYISGQMGREKVKQPAVDPAVQRKIRESQYSQAGWQEEARQVLSSFLAADSAAGKAAFSIRGSEQLAQMNEFYGKGPIDDTDTLLAGFASANLPSEDHKRGIFRMVYDQPPQFEMREFFRPLAPMEVQFGLQEPDLLLSSLARASNFSSEPVKVEVFFKREPDGLKIDWETFVQTKYRTFRSFTELADPGRSGVFRLFVVEDVPERGRASQGTKTYRLADPAHKTDSVRVEVPVDSELGRSLSILNWRGVKDARPITKTVTLELEWTREASPRLAVKRFICWEFLGIGGQAVAAAPPSGQK